METSWRGPASETSVYSLSEFEDLAKELSGKVNLFKAVWEKDPEAEFFGGTSRDYLYWLKGKLSSAKNRTEYDKIVSGLRSLQVIDVRDFIIGESDVDIVAKKTVAVSADDFGVKNIDTISFERFDVNTQAGRDELAQGFIPVEKIRLGKEGVVDNGRFGNGMGEVYSGKISVKFSSPAEFASTRFAKLKLNHPVLLALRYVRLTAMQYAALFGKGHPDKEILFEMMGENKDLVKKVIADASKDRVLKEYLENQKFSEWINGTLKKGYRSYTNPTATKMLHDELGVEVLTSSYTEIEPLKPYLFAQFKDTETIDRALSESGIDRTRFFGSISDYFPNGLMYHGTRTDEGFRGILYQGVMESSNGVGGRGLYAVAEDNMDFAIKWGGHKDRVVEFKVKPDAVIVDISKEGYARTVFERSGLTEDAFCEKYGIDILKYQYRTDAFVVKNSNALGEVNGTFRKLKSFSKILDDAVKVSNHEELIDFIKMGESNRITADEWKTALGSIENLDTKETFKRLLREEQVEMASHFLHTFEGDEQFDALKKVLDSSMAAYESQDWGQIINKSYYTTKNIIQKNFPDKLEWFFEYHNQKWRNFVVKAYTWPGDAWELNEHIQIQKIVRERFSLLNTRLHSVENGEKLVKEMWDLYTEALNTEKFVGSNQILEYTMNEVRRHYYHDDINKVFRPMRDALEKSLIERRDVEFPHREIRILADMYVTDIYSIRDESDKNFSFRYIMKKYYEKHAVDVADDHIHSAFLSLTLHEYNDPFTIRYYREIVQPLYEEKLKSGVSVEKADLYIKLLGSLAEKEGNYNALKKLPALVKAQGYPKELVAKARRMAGKPSLTKTCKDYILRLFGQ